jgi:hypothetical protein
MRILFCLLALLLVLNTGSRSFAQSGISPEMQQRMAEELKVTHFGPGLSLLFNPRARLSQPDLPVLKIFHGTEGTAIQLPQKVDAISPQSMKVASNFAVSQYQRSGKEYSESISKALPLARCQSAKTDRVSSGIQNPPNPKEVVVDMLFIDANKMPLDPDEAFGRNTTVIPYHAKEQAGIEAAIRALGVNCLPTRLRATQTYRIRHEGEPAVRNYEGNPHGHGKLHPSMKDRV